MSSEEKLGKMGVQKERQRYSEEFRTEAIRMVTELGLSTTVVAEKL